MKENEILDSSENSNQKTSSRSMFGLFLSAQVAAFIGTAVDFLMTYLLTEFAGVWYVISNSIGAAFGAITNFLLGRYWVFSSTQKKIYHQAFKYFLVALGSLILNTLGVYLLTEYTSLYYIYSKIIVAIVIAVSYNFLLQKNFVFR